MYLFSPGRTVPSTETVTFFAKPTASSEHLTQQLFQSIQADLSLLTNNRGTYV